jgi:hypothetical protein
MGVLAGGEEEVSRHGGVGPHLRLVLARPEAVCSGLATHGHGWRSAGSQLPPAA